jgi:hypothetical protein
MNNFGSRPVKPEERKKWIRPHVKAIAYEISEHAGRWTQTVLGDSAQAQPMMEHAVAVVSHYLTIKGEPLHRGKTKTLLRASFRRGLQRDAASLNCGEILGGTSDC